MCAFYLYTTSERDRERDSERRMTEVVTCDLLIQLIGIYLELILNISLLIYRTSVWQLFPNLTLRNANVDEKGHVYTIPSLSNNNNNTDVIASVGE